ncbi:hypothetical protein DICSQDRAFT_55495 [Dichomitus squalens LYAD-421 SS1]|uniref:uncharacterized protein n=1 Tax=Dichomitus squalens (strain LYAD-421) TaxID=732165 RepID=UPI0004411F62|nr:uncharacterized protein DICSQDRAFT_55495 [Dichomitus squalens LYAD-421 SS1]EJF63190.1 hypothetical protein DICSQDRAFT_55495 [Dichomitus squalens LYAD-421 SS1]
MASKSANAIQILDIHTRVSPPSGASIRDQIVSGLSQPVGGKTLPTLLLYDERGLRLYDEITTDAAEYYLFPAEEEILKNKADGIVRVMHSGIANGELVDEVVVELGAGALRKTSLILGALARLVPNPAPTPPISYHALDLEKRELERTLMELNSSHVGVELKGKVATAGLCGTYDDGLKFIVEGGLQDRNALERIDTAFGSQYPVERVGRDASPSSAASSRGRTDRTEATPPSTPGAQQPLHILFLGSSLGNFARGEDAAFLKSLPLRPGSGDTLLLGMDHGNDARRIEAAYNDSKGVTRKFIMNGLVSAGRALGDESLFAQDKWEYVGKYNEESRRHEAYYRSACDQTVVDPETKALFPFVKDELIRVEVSHKYSERDAWTVFTEANLCPVHRWTDRSSQYSLWLLERPKFSFPLLKWPSSSDAKTVARSPFSLPTVDEWRDMWAAWDFITRQMIPPSMLFQKPIDLRHICLFYCGHIPAFLSIHLSKLLQEPDTEPVEYKYIFERGIDPIVDDPTQCHPHSEVPQKDEDWPSLPSILQFQSRVRERVINLYRDIDSGKVTLTRKIARVMQMTLEHEAFHAETLLYMLLQRAGTGTIPPSGFIPPPWEVLAESWDKQPLPAAETVTLGPEEISLGHDDDESQDDSTEGVLEHSFGWDNEHPKRTVKVEEFKIEWRPVTNGQFYEFYTGPGKDKVQFPKSWVELDGEVFVRTLYGPVPIKIAWHWPIKTSYDNLSVYANVKGGRIPTEPELRLFLDKFECGYEGGANVGFRNWHPVPATTGGPADGGKGHNGGVWEWTSTVLDKYEGFVPSKLYPGYSTDFFDTHHQVVIGGSYTTIPRLAERRTVRNYYQHNYPYAWVGARVAYDV